MKILNISITTILLCFGSLLAWSQQRIVTAGSATSEIVCALGHCSQIVATDRTSTYPEKLTSLPSIGYRNSISAEGIIALTPNPGTARARLCER